MCTCMSNSFSCVACLADDCGQQNGSYIDGMPPGSARISHVLVPVVLELHLLGLIFIISIKLNFTGFCGRFGVAI